MLFLNGMVFRFHIENDDDCKGVGVLLRFGVFGLLREYNVACGAMHDVFAASGLLLSGASCKGPALILQSGGEVLGQ